MENGKAEYCTGDWLPLCALCVLCALCEINDNPTVCAVRGIHNWKQESLHITHIDGCLAQLLDFGIESFTEFDELGDIGNAPKFSTTFHLVQ